MPARRDGGRGEPGPLEGSLFLLQSALLDNAAGETRESLAARNAVATAHWEEGRREEAVGLLAENAAACTEVLGEDDPDTLVAVGNLAAVECSLGRWGDGLGRLRANVAARERVLGQDHPGTLTARDALGAALRLAGAPQEALRSSGNVAAQRARVLGPAHPDTLTSRIGHALDLADVGDVESAVDQLVAALDDAEQAHGTGTYVAAVIRGHLASCLAELGRVEAAAQEAREAAAVSEAALGAQHPDTVALREESAALAAALSP